MTTRFQDRYGPYALVAGGSYGLGAAFAESIARRGVNVVILARQSDQLRATAERLSAEYGVEVIPIAVDLADLEKAKERITELTVPLGLLVYDAAYAPIGRFEDVTEEQLARAADVNVRAPLLLVKFLSGPMIQRGRGGIILMSSLAGSQGSPTIAAYAATKAFTTVLAEGLWNELAPRGVDVLACVAGAILTPAYRRAEKARSAPGTMDAAEVAERTIRALGKGPIVVPGAVNKVGRFILTRLLSRRAAIAIMAKNTGGLS